MALDVVVNAKMRRTGVCGSTETVLIDEAIANEFLPTLADKLSELGCEMRGGKNSQTIRSDIKSATEHDYFTEHLAPIVNIRICLLYTSPSPRDLSTSRMPSSA